MTLSQILPRCTYLISFAFCPFPLTAFFCWHPHLSNSNKKEKVPRAACFLPSQPCHLEQTPLLFASCSNTIPVQNSTKNHTIPLGVWTRLLELLCVFNCSPYFSSCGTACDLHLWVGRDVWRLLSSANKLTRQGVTKKISFLSRTTIRTNHVATIEWHNDLQA